MQHAELKEIGLHSVGHRLTILKAVYETKVKQNVPIEPDHYVPLCTAPYIPSTSTANSYQLQTHLLKMPRPPRKTSPRLYVSCKHATSAYTPARWRYDTSRTT